MQETEGVETLETGGTEEASGAERAAKAIVAEPAAMVAPVDNPVARTREPQPAVKPEPLMNEPESSGKTGEIEEELSRLRQLATQLAHDAARILLDAADGEGGFRGGDIRRRELLKLRASVMEYLRDHERRTKRRIFEDVEDRQVLGLD
jgi:hypothetical protein